MIEKIDLDRRNSFGTVDWLENMNEPSGAKLIETKINELVDAVNELTSCVGQLGVEFTNEETKEPADPYAEQRKWVGKICKFWNDDDSPDNVMYGELVNVFDVHKEDCPFQCGYGEWYEYCEPVKPDDNIIYKGE